MKASSETSAKAATAALRPTARSSAPPTRTSADSFALSGPSDLPDPLFNAYRKDLADCALVGQVIASHYAEPLQRALASAASLRGRPSEDSEVLLELEAGEPFAMLDNSLGWAWGYAGKGRHVGYVPSAAIAG